MLTIALVFLPVSITIGWYIYCYWCMRTLRHLPGPFTLPIIGNGMDFRNTAAFLPTCTEYFKKYGPIVKIMLGTYPVVLIADHKALENVLSSPKLLKKSVLYKFLHNWLNSGLLTSEGGKWKQRRRMLTPSYHFQILEQFVPTFNKVGNVLIEQFSKADLGSPIDVHPYVSLAALDVICETAMGIPINAQVNQSSEYVDSIRTLTRIILQRLFTPYQHHPFLYQFTENYRIEQKCLKVVHSYTKAVIEKRRKDLLGYQTDSSNSEHEDGVKKRVAFLDTLLSATDGNGEYLSDEDIQEEVDTFMFEGHDTSAAAISFALYEIANNPHVQNKILEEQKRLFDDDDTCEITYSDLKRMKYLDLVIKETLRMYPSIPFYGRQTEEEFKLTDDTTLPANFTIFVLANDIHQDERYFKNPEKFDPERFREENNGGKQSYRFVPFSAGPRNCIGQKFAMLEIKSTLAKIVQHFELTPTVPKHKLKLVSEAILKSVSGIFIQMKKRVK